MNIEANVKDGQLITIRADTAGFFAIKVRGNDYSFDVVDEHGRATLSSSPRTSSRWTWFLGHGEHQIYDNDTNAFIATVSYRALGVRRSVTVGGQCSPFPRKPAFSILGMNWLYQNGRLTVGNIDVKFARPVVGLASYWTIRQLSADHSS